MKIGDTVYRFNVNRRVYRKTGPSSGPPIYREHFEPFKIVGENRQWWLLEHGWKVNKKTGRGNAAAYQFGLNGFFTAEAMEDDIWSDECRSRICDAVRQASVADLRKVAELIGWTPREDK